MSAQTISDLGKLVKNKYPGSYDDMDDAALGRAVKAKYPGSYDDFADAPAVSPGPDYGAIAKKYGAIETPEPAPAIPGTEALGLPGPPPVTPDPRTVVKPVTAGEQIRTMQGPEGQKRAEAYMATKHNTPGVWNVEDLEQDLMMTGITGALPKLILAAQNSPKAAKALMAANDLAPKPATATQPTPQEVPPATTPQATQPSAQPPATATPAPSERVGGEVQAADLTREVIEAEAELRSLRQQYDAAREGDNLVQIEDLAEQIHDAATRLDSLQARAAESNPLLVAQPRGASLPELPTGKQSYRQQLMDEATDTAASDAERYLVDYGTWVERGRKGNPPEKPDPFQIDPDEYPARWNEAAIKAYRERFDAEAEKGVKEIEAEETRGEEPVTELPAESNPSIEIPLKASEVSFQQIADKIGNSLAPYTFKADNGATIHAQRKVTTAGGVIKTKYLHVSIKHPNGKIEHYREQKDGNFRLTGGAFRPPVSQAAAAPENAPGQRILQGKGEVEPEALKGINARIAEKAASPLPFGKAVTEHGQIEQEYVAALEAGNEARAAELAPKLDAAAENLKPHYSDVTKIPLTAAEIREYWEVSKRPLDERRDAQRRAVYEGAGGKVEPKPEPKPETTLTRTTPAPGTPERAKLDADDAATEKAHEELMQERIELERERDKTKRHSKKYEQIEKRLEKLREQEHAAWQQHDVVRKQHYQALLEDAASQSENPILRAAARYGLRERELKGKPYSQKEHEGLQKLYTEARDGIKDELRKVVPKVEDARDKAQAEQLTPEENEKAIEDAITSAAQGFMDHPLTAGDIEKRLGGNLYAARKRAIGTNAEKEMDALAVRLQEDGGIHPSSTAFARFRQRIQQGWDEPQEILAEARKYVDEAVAVKEKERAAEREVALSLSRRVRPLAELESPAMNEKAGDGDTKVWDGNVIQGASTLLSDGHAIIDSTVIRDKKRAASLRAKGGQKNFWPEDKVRSGAWGKFTVEATDHPLEEIGTVDSGGYDTALFTTKKGEVVSYSAKRIRFIQALTGATDIRGGVGEKKAAVFFKDGKPAALLVSLKKTPEIDVKVAREAAAKPKPEDPDAPNYDALARKYRAVEAK